ncbi:MAG TPA: hypothetical protein VLB73_00580 [Patescibacteria group bacterium]|nr:hypothetical protein [Patescibacteria group bacterium]
MVNEIPIQLFFVKSPGLKIHRGQDEPMKRELTYVANGMSEEEARRILRWPKDRPEYHQGPFSWPPLDPKRDGYDDQK